MPKSDAERKAEQRARDKKNGLIELTVKIRKKHVEKMREYEKKLQK